MPKGDIGESLAKETLTSNGFALKPHKVDDYGCARYGGHFSDAVNFFKTTLPY
jgi:hypothetical protein